MKDVYIIHVKKRYTCNITYSHV